MCSAVCCQGEAEGLSPADFSPSACLDRLQHCIFMRRTNLTIRDDGALVLANALHYKIFFVDLIASQLLPVFFTSVSTSLFMIGSLSLLRFIWQPE